MRRLALAVAVAASILTITSSASAQCAFDGSAKAKGMKTSMIRAFASCPAGTFPAPNSQTGTGVPTCSPPFAWSPYEFHDRKSGCTFSSKSRIEDECPQLSPAPCMALTLKLKCTGVMEPGGVIPTSDPGFALNVIMRATLDDEDNGDMSAIDFPVIFQLLAEQGKLTIAGQIELHATATLGLSPCAQLEIVRVTIQDPDGNPFARIGAGTREAN